MKRSMRTVCFLFFVFLCGRVTGQNIYDLRKLTEQDWLAMTAEERLNALGRSNAHAQNQTYLGNFGTNYDSYRKWGYDFYEMEDRYENYSFRGFENYNIIEERRLRWSYNEFGDRIARMRYDGNIWNETYSGDGTFTVTMPHNYINAIAFGEIDGVWLARESTEDWAVSVIGAGALRTKYTPLTLSLPNMPGMRIDWQSQNNTMSVINSNQIINQGLLVSRGGVLLRGGRFSRKLGVLTIGATYVNMYGAQGNREGGDSWYGTVSNFTPTPLVYALRFMDDSPDDNEGGPTIYSVRLKVNGKYRDDIKPKIILDDVTRDRTTAITKVTEQAYVDPMSTAGNGRPEFDTLRLFENMPKYADFYYYLDYVKGANLKNVQNNYDLNLAQQYFQFIDPGSEVVKVNGSQTVVYWFDITSITDQVNRVEAEKRKFND